MSRKRNFEEQEIGKLLSTYKENLEILNAKFGNAITKKKKQKWEELTNAVNSVGRQNRTVDEIKHKWKDLLSRAKDFSNRRHPKTGGGPKPTEGPYTDIVLDIIGEVSPVLIGISSGGESALQDAKSDDDSNLTIDTTVDNVNQTGSYAVEVSAKPNSTECQSESHLLPQNKKIKQSDSKVTREVLHMELLKAEIRKMHVENEKN